MRMGSFAIAAVAAITLARSASAACVLPDDGNSDSCPQYHWSEDSDGLFVRDYGEALWADAGGVLHVARHLQDVPEPYRALYKTMHKQSNGARVVVDDVPAFHSESPEADAISPNATAEAYRRQQWRDEVTHWRTELYTSTRGLLEAVLHPAADAQNPLAFAYEPERQLAAQTQSEVVTQARLRVLHARAMLLEELPNRARREGVPPAWLQ